jgi:hypothetical protein
LDIGVEWLFAQFAPTSNLDLRIGRVVLPAFMISDSRNVGYSQPWLRAPVEVYTVMPLSNLDGVQANWRIPVGAAIFSLQPSYGKSQINISPTPTNVIDQMNKYGIAVNASVEWESWTVRLGRIKSELPFSSPLLNQPPLNISLPINYEMKDTFSSAGLQYDNGSAVFMTEWAQRHQDNLPLAPPGFSGQSLFFYGLTQLGGTPLAESHSWYAAGGYHLNKWMPMFTYANFINTAPSSRFSSASTSVSLRYDFISGVDFKAQIGRYDARDPNIFIGSSLLDTRHVLVFSAGMDFVF